MDSWSVHHLFDRASKELGVEKAFNLQKYASNLRDKGLPVIFSLMHLSHITGIDYDILRNTVNRRRESANYNLFAISKRSGGKRFIHAVNGKLFRLHQFINENILQKTNPHPSSFAFHHNGGVLRCVSKHCGCRWLFQFDLKDFFYSIAEPLVFKAFSELGYNGLLSFELSRICTTLRLPVNKSIYLKESSDFMFGIQSVDINKPYFPQQIMGVLPQGAPTSPMISNLAANKLDIALAGYAKENGFIYTRYADDLAFSSSCLPKNVSIARIKREVVSIIRKCGFIENNEKFRVAGPGSRKILLGMLVDRARPRVSREFLKRIQRHIYATQKFGLDMVAKYEKFDSVYGFYNHLLGLMSYLKDVDHGRWEILNEIFSQIQSPF